MLSIGDFAHLGGVSVRTLRHYDEIGLLRPARVDPHSGYRAYSAGQLGQLNRIVALKDLGLSLAQVRRLTRPGREIWINEADGIADADQQVFEIQLPFTRPQPAAM